jgi:DNA adenine methylase
MKPLFSPIKWAGGKRWLAPRVAAMFHESGARRLVEPFCGAASVSLYARPKHAWLGDVNYQLINFWWHVKNGHPLEDVGGNVLEDYENARREFNARTSPPERAASLFYYLNKTCFNGLYRVNSVGEFNVPFGKHRTVNYKSSFPEIAEAMQGWSVAHGDFDAWDTDPDDFIYIDPPYDGQFSGFTQGRFLWDDHVRLATWMSKQSGTVVVSNSSSERVQHLYKAFGFGVELIDAPRSISCDGNRKRVKEVFAIKPKKKLTTSRSQVINATY